jgi:transposase
MDKEQLRQAILEMNQAGAPPTEIAEELEVSVSTIYRILNQLGATSQRGKKSVLDELSNEDRQTIIQRYIADDPLIDIINEYGLNYNALYRLLREEGVPLKEIKVESKRAVSERMEHAIKLYIKGVPIWKIEAETGVRQPQLHSELHRQGITLRRQSR